MSTVHQSITTMDSIDTPDNIGQNFMHQTNDEICIGENSKVTQHYPYFRNADVGDNEDHLEAPHRPILAVNVEKNNAHIFQSKNVLEGHTRFQPRSSFSPFDSNCPKQRRIFNFCDQVDLQTIERGKGLYTGPCGININLILLAGLNVSGSGCKIHSH